MYLDTKLAAIGLMVSIFIPTGTVVFMSGQQVERMASLDKHMTTLSQNVENLTDNVFTMKESVGSNKTILKRVDGKVFTLEMKVDQHGKKIAVLEAMEKVTHIKNNGVTG